MIRNLAVIPFVFTLSLLVGLVAWVGGVVKRFPLFAWSFDWLIGFDQAERIRDEHIESLVDAVAAHEIDYDVSKQLLIEETRENHRENISQITRGESAISVSIALIAVLFDRLPGSLQLPLGISIPLPSLNTVLFLLTTLLVVSVAFRQTAIEAQESPSPCVFDSYDELMTKLAWNGGTLNQSKLVYNIVLLQIIREWDERFYHIYLNKIIVDVVQRGGMSKREAMSRYWGDLYDVMEQKYDWMGSR